MLSHSRKIFPGEGASNLGQLATPTYTTRYKVCSVICA